jgi:dipeptidyl-peptidase 4
MILRTTLFILLSLSCGADELRERLANKVFRAVVEPTWTDDSTAFWYRVQTSAEGHEFVLTQAETGAQQRAATLKELGLPAALPIRTSATTIDIRPSKRTGEETAIQFHNPSGGTVRVYWLNPDGERIARGSLKAGEQREQHSFAGHVWLFTNERDEPLATLEAKATMESWIIDGKGRPPQRLTRRASGVQSPNGQFTISTAAEPVPQRQITIVESSPADALQPRLKVIDYTKPGDALPKPQWVIKKKAGPTLQVATDLYPNPFTVSGKLSAIWAPDSREFYFDYNQRGHQLYRVLAVDSESATVRVVVEERSDTFIDYTQKTWRHWLHETGELLWMSERDGWCHLWLYDSIKGQAKHQITKGKWPVRQVLHVDPTRREVWFYASGLRATEDPYHLHLCRVRFDGSDFIQLTEADGHHEIAFSPDRRFFTATWSRVDHPPVHELRRSADGHLVTVLEKADASALLATGWQMPERFVAKGRDGTTDIHGVILRPSHFDPGKRYPVVENIYAGPHSAFAPKTFDRLLSMHRIAEQGFIVVKLDGMGTNHRGKKFHDVCWKDLKDAGFPDRKAWITAAAKTRPWMDLSRVGIYGGSAGGQSAMRAVLDHHDFYKVAVADCGCHDNRMDKIWWNEQWMGWPVDESYVRSSNVEDAHKLRGKLLLIVGELDTNVDPATTTQVVAALQRAGKDFVFMPIINAGHGAAETEYGEQLRLAFLVRHLKP